MPIRYNVLVDRHDKLYLVSMGPNVKTMLIKPCGSSYVGVVVGAPMHLPDGNVHPMPLYMKPNLAWIHGHYYPHYSVIQDDPDVKHVEVKDNTTNKITMVRKTVGLVD